MPEDFALFWRGHRVTTVHQWWKEYLKSVPQISISYFHRWVALTNLIIIIGCGCGALRCSKHRGYLKWSFYINSWTRFNPTETLCRLPPLINVMSAPHRSYLPMNALKRRAGTGTWSTSAATSARPPWAASATSWRTDGHTAATASSPFTQSTATHVENT